MNCFFKTLIFSLGAVVLLMGTPSWATDPIKVGVLDLQKCLNQSESGKKASKALQDKSDRIKKDLSARRDELKKGEEELAKKSTLLSADARREKEKELLRKKEDFRDLVQEKEEEMRKDEYNAMQPLLNELFEITSKLARDEGYTMILEAKSGVVYFSKTVEITDKIIKLFNESKKVEKKK